MNQANLPDQADEALAEYMAREDRGEPVDRQAFLADRPDLAADLGNYFAACDDLADLAGGASPHAARLAYPASSPEPPSTALAEPDFCARAFGDYEIVEEIARGGMGVIYKARQYLGGGDPRPFRLVALKMIRAGQMATDVEVERFHDEAEAVAHLDHPHIVPIYEVGEHEGHHYFCMKLLDGGSLAQRMGEVRLPLWTPRTGRDAEGTLWAPAQIDQRKTKLVRLVATVARAIHHAHQRGLIHRDLKPANILLDAQEQPHVTDFGLAKRLPAPELLNRSAGRPTLSSAIVGTPNYMAPEQARGDKGLSTAADVWSLGAIFYELLTGRPPFRESTPLATLMKVLDEQPPPPRVLNPLVDADLETICLKCLRKEGAERYGSAQELANDLDRWLAGEPIHARSVGPVERCLKWMRRRPALAALAGFSFVIALLALTVTIWETAQTRNARAVAEQRLYQRNIALAQHERHQHVGRAIGYLEDCEVFRRRWEWHYLDRLCHQELRTLSGHQGAAVGVAYSPDGQRVLSTGADHTIRVWDARTGALLQTLTGHTDGVLGVACRSDGKQFASAGADGVIKLWDAATGTELFTLHGHTKAVTSVAYSPASDRLLSGSEDGTVRLWDPTTGQPLTTLYQHERMVTAVAFRPDGQHVASAGSDGKVQVWNLSRGETVFSPPTARWEWTALAFSPNGKWLAAAGSTGRVLVWDLETKTVQYDLRGPTHWLHSIAFVPDGKRLATSAANGAILVWDVADEFDHLRFILNGHTRRVNGLACSPDGRRFASASTDGTVKLWDAVTNPEQHSCPAHPDAVAALAFQPAGQWLASAGRDGSLWISAPRTGQRLRELPVLSQTVRCLAATVDGAGLLCGGSDGRLRVLNVATGALLREWPAHEEAICGLALQAEGRELLTAGMDGTLRRWEIATGQLVREYPRIPGVLTAAAFSPEGHQLVVARLEPGPRMELIELQTGRSLHQFEDCRGPVFGLAYGGPERLASVGSRGTIQLWDVAVGKEVLSLPGHLDTLLAVAFSADGHLLATGGQDKSVRVYDGTPR